MKFIIYSLLFVLLIETSFVFSQKLSPCTFLYFDFTPFENLTYQTKGKTFGGAEADYFWSICGVSNKCNSLLSVTNIGTCQNVTSGMKITGEVPGVWSSNGTSLAVFYNSSGPDTCANKRTRSTYVHLTCGLDTTTLKAYENISPYCEFHMEMFSPRACRKPAFSSLSLSQFPMGSASLAIYFSTLESIPQYTISVNGMECNNLVTPTQFFCALPIQLINGGNYTVRIFSKSAIGIPEFSYTINDFVLLYPVVSSVNQITTNGGNLTLGGNFGRFQEPLVKVNGVLCDVLSASETELICRVNGTLVPGNAQLDVSVDGYNFTTSKMLTIINANYTQCQQQGCSGHGTCNPMTGTCDCDDKYYGPQCNLQSGGGGIFKPNPVEPSADIEYNGYTFRFSIYSVQEVRTDGSIEHEVTPQFWNVTIDNTTSVALLDYDMVQNSTSQAKLKVRTRISFSNESRTFTFGSKSYNLAPNSVKVGVNVSDWKYASNLNYLRVVFITGWNPRQTIGCDGKEVASFNTDDQKSIQSLMVVKDDVIYYGRFLEYVVSDGRETYSTTELLQTNEQSKTALLAINFPQCKHCELDPDFSSLVSTDYKQNCKVVFETWKIALIAGLVGGTLLIGLGIIIYTKRKSIYLRYLTMTAKKDPNVNLSKLNSSSTVQDV